MGHPREYNVNKDNKLSDIQGNVKVTYSSLDCKEYITRVIKNEFEVLGVMSIEVDLNFINSVGLLCGTVEFVEGNCEPYEVGDEISITIKEYEIAVEKWELRNERDYF